MKLLKNFIATLMGTYDPAGTIGAGQPVGHNRQLAAAGAVGILGIAKEDVVVADTGASVLIIGQCQVVGAGVIAVGARVKVAAA